MTTIIGSSEWYVFGWSCSNAIQWSLAMRIGAQVGRHFAID